MATRKVEAKDLVVLFDRDGRIVDYRFNSSLSDVRIAPAPEPAVVHIFIPVHK
jgi:hypothetical protein